MTKKNHRSADAVADYFLLKIRVDEGDLIGNLKMQKLCYFAQGWSLAQLGKSLFDDSIEAWARGPVIPELYRRFKPYRWGALDASRLKTEPLKELAQEERNLLDRVWKHYGHFSGSQLVEATHAQKPWKDVYGDRPLGERCEGKISQESIKEYFESEFSKKTPSSRRGSKGSESPMACALA